VHAQRLEAGGALAALLRTLQLPSRLMCPASAGAPPAVAAERHLLQCSVRPSPTAAHY
jgi:hypothetical protein